MLQTLIQIDPYASGFNIDDFSRIDGTGNNLEQPSSGGSGTRYRQLNPIDYADGIYEPAGQDRPNPRVISNRLFTQTEPIPDPRGLSAITWIFGQFLNHDIDDAKVGTEPLPITLPPGDPQIGNFGFEFQLGLFRRNAIDPDTGPPFNVVPGAQINLATPWVDGSVIYGTSTERLNALRTFEGGKLATSAGNLGPLDNTDLPNALGPSRDKEQFFLFGDVRGNQQAGLTAMQTLWLREHNYIADQLATAHPDWTDEQIFQRARAIVIGEFQAVTYNEYLPAILGVENVPQYAGYDPDAVAQTSLTFATAAFRMGHSTVANDFLLLNNDRSVIDELFLSLAFFNPLLFQNNPALVDQVLLGSTVAPNETADAKMVDAIRNFFSDLAAENIQRGREHGLPSYTVLRDVLDRLRPTGRPFPQYTSLTQLTSDPETIAALQDLYGGGVSNIDMWVGMLAEELPTNAAGEVTSSVPPLAAEIIRVVFQRLRDGDRYYYKNPIESGGIFNSAEILAIDGTRLSDIIERNTDITGLQDNVFYVPSASGSASRSIDPLTGSSSADVFVLELADGVPDQILDFTDGVDAIALTDGLEFADLVINDFAADGYSGTVISEAGSGDMLAVVLGVAADLFDASDFVAADAVLV
jgi:peroxidase